MERAAKVLLESKLASKRLSPEGLAQACWRGAVGKRIANVARAGSLVNGRLRVHVADDVWRDQLGTMKAEILAQIRRIAAPGLVNDIEFQVMPGRRGPHVEESPVRLSRALAGTLDEADLIQDPVLSRIYKASRKRESA
jgi:hypothetical protein